MLLTVERKSSFSILCNNNQNDSTINSLSTLNDSLLTENDTNNNDYDYSKVFTTESQDELTLNESLLIENIPENNNNFSFLDSIIEENFINKIPENKELESEKIISFYRFYTEPSKYNKFIDLLIDYFYMHVNDVIIKNSSNLSPIVNIPKKSNNKKSLSFSCKNILNISNSLNNDNFQQNNINIEDLINNISSNEESLNDIIKMVISFCFPNSYSFITTFILMSDIIEKDEGKKYLNNLNSIFMSSLYIATQNLEYKTYLFESLFSRTEIINMMVDDGCLSKIKEILFTKDKHDYKEHELMFNLLFDKIN